MVHQNVRIWTIQFLILYNAHSFFCNMELDAYYQKREQLVDKSLKECIGGKLVLTDKEQIINQKLMTWKNEEYEVGRKDSKQFWASQHFFTSKPHIDQSKIFDLIKKLPKGALLHSHSLSMVSDTYVFNNITYRENLYAKLNENGSINLHFFKNPPNLQWKPISMFRKNSETFNEILRQQLTLVRNNPEIYYAYADTNDMWSLFGTIFAIHTTLLSYLPVFKDYFYQALKEFYEDNIRYVEFRTSASQTVYDIEGRTYGIEKVFEIYYEVSLQFMQDYPNFWGMKVILAPDRHTSLSSIEQYAHIIETVNKKFPNLIAGFDLVGEESVGYPLKSFIPALLKIQKDTQFFFHAGETLWNGLDVDQNLIDAILLNTTRIGHSYAIVKHPEVLQVVKERNIPLEICPISNQVLGLVKDLRNHPANYLIANDFPVVIASDDPGFWGAKGVSYDWYVTFMGMSSKETDLRLLKQLAINSINYSNMDKGLKETAMKKWEKEWSEFLKNAF